MRHAEIIRKSRGAIGISWIVDVHLIDALRFKSIKYFCRNAQSLGKEPKM